MPMSWGGSHRHGRLLLAAALALGIALLAVSLTRSSTPAQQTALASGSTHASPVASETVSDPIDRKYLTEVPFGSTSFWIQPWRAYLDTWPASRLIDSLGINFNVNASQARATARLLHESGFKLARIELNWSSLSYNDPSGFADEASVRTRLDALREYGLRPLILLDANSGAPVPAQKITLQTVASAPSGASTVTLSPASAAAVVPGRTGFDSLVFNPHQHTSPHAHSHTGKATSPLTPEQRRRRREERRAEHRARSEAGFTPIVLQGNPAILITKISHDVATLSRPLPAALAVGSYHGTTLLYAPFTAPTLANGAPNPAFQATLHGWLGYVAAVSNIARRIFGPGGYDLEVWNELSFGSQFLNAEDYSRPAGAGGPSTVTKEVTKALLRETLAYVRNPANGISPEVGVSNGFASQTPFSSGALAPAGLTAFSKHLYAGAKSFPAEFHARPGHVPRDALGRRDTAGPRRSAGAFTPLFVPHYQSLFPEYYLSATSPETVIRNLSPFTTYIYKTPYGRYASPPHQSPPQVWMTEYNLALNGATVVGPNESTPVQTTLTPADKAHFQAKALLRSLVAMINKGMTREYFYAAAGHALALIPPNFYTALQAHPETYPGDALGGETMSAFRNMLAQFQGPGPGQGPGPSPGPGPGPGQGSGTSTSTNPRQLTLLTITQNGNHAQFTGDGTTAHPNLYDREVLAVLPFQSTPTRYVIPIYVMTRDLLTLYQPEAPTSDIHRFDLPNETFRITLGNLPQTTTPPTITAYDPLRNETTPAKLITQTSHTATIEIATTDYPRILTIQYR
jgi:hypothetical protein